MKVCIWGARGSIPATFNADRARAKVKSALEVAVRAGIGPDSNLDDFIDEQLPFSVRSSYGTNTPCVQIDESGDNYLVCDAGTGLRDLGNKIMEDRGGRPGAHIHLLFSHLHWDHVQGFPFFIPAYIEGNRISIYGGHPGIEKTLRAQQGEPGFPVNFKHLKAEFDFNRLSPDEDFEIMGIRIRMKTQYHPGGSFGYRFEKNGKTVVYSTDCEHKSSTALTDMAFVEFFRNADLLIMDAQYTFADANSVKEDWGHSNNIVAVELSGLAGVKTLCLFHQEPVLDDFALESFLEDTRNFARIAEYSPREIIMAWDGLRFEL